MDFLKWIIDFVLHVDIHMAEIIKDYGTWTYLILFSIIFSETGFVVTPFLPGDSLLFVIGAFSAKGSISYIFVVLLLILAAVGGNVVNYIIGRTIGDKIKNSKIIKKEYMDRTHAFYEKHGGKAIIISRFMPIIRTFVPFIAGIGKMNFGKFILYNIIGGSSWVLLLTTAGYLFGGIPIIENNLSIVIYTIVMISFLPAVITWINNKISKHKLNKNTN